MHKDAVLKADDHLIYLGRLVGEALGTKRTSSQVGHRDGNIPSEWGDVKPGRDEAISILMDRVKDALTSRMELDIDLKRKCELPASWGKHDREEARKRVDSLRMQVDKRAGRRWVSRKRKREDMEAMASFERHIMHLESEHKRKVREACEHLEKVTWKRRGGGWW